MQAATPARTPLGFALTIVDGRAVLTGGGEEGGRDGGLGRLDRIALEVPGLRFPFDLTQGPRAFRSRRCRLTEFAYSVAPGELTALLVGAGLRRFGLSLPTVTLGPGGQGLRVALRAEVAGREAELTAKLTVSTVAARPGATAGTWRFALTEARLHGFVAIPAPLLLAGLPAALGLLADGVGATGSEEGRARASVSTDAQDADVDDDRLPGPLAAPSAAHWAMRSPALIRPRGLTEWDVDLAELVLVARLAPAGWRLPARERLESRPVAIAEGRLAFALGRPGDVPEPEGEGEGDGERRPGEVAERGLAALAEAAFSAGELRPAAEGFRRALAAEPGSAFARERLFQLLGSFPDGMRELDSSCDAALEGQPDLGLALVGKAVAAAEGGRAADAAAIYTRLAVAAEADGETLDEAAAWMAAAEQLRRAGDQAAALGALERVLALRPDHAVAARLLSAPQGTPA
jgi:hypothetical protein